MISLISLFVALGGSAYALSRNSVGTAQLKRGAVATGKIKRNAVTASKIRDRSLNRTHFRQGVLERATMPKFEVAASATELTYAEARNAADDIHVIAIGPAELYGKCFTVLNSETETNQTYAAIFIRTDEDGVLFRSPLDSAFGHELLRVDTPIAKREITAISASADSTNASPEPPETFVLAPDRKHAARFETPVAVKNGRPSSGNGPFGEGDVCLFMSDELDYSSR